MPPKKPPYAEFAHRLFIAQKRYELKTGKTFDRERLASAVGKSDSTVSNWFTGKQMPSVEQLAAIGKALGTSPSWLAFGDQSEFTTPDGEPIESPSQSEQGRRRR